MRGRLPALAVVLAAAWPASAAAQDHGHGGSASGAAAAVVIAPSSSFEPERASIVTGESVFWRNDDHDVHTVTLEEGMVELAEFGFGESFSHRFDTAGAHPYLCTIHPGMTGQVDVHAALLSAAKAAVAAGDAVELRGRAPAGTAGVTLEHRPAPATSFTALQTVAVGSDGRFAVSVRPGATTDYRVVTGAGISPLATVTVSAGGSATTPSGTTAPPTPGVNVRVGVRRGKRFTRLLVRAAAAPAATATLRLYTYERFTWRTAHRTRLDAAGRASFRLRAGRRYRARVILTRADGTVVARSATIRVPRRHHH
jgi:plastocyanin